MPNSLEQDLVLRLKNVDQVLRQLKSKIDNTGLKNLGDIQISPQATRELINLARAIGAAKPAFRDASVSLETFGRSLQRVATGLKGAAPVISSYTRFMNAATKAQVDFNREQSRTSDFSNEFGRQTGIAARRFGGFLIARDIVAKVGLAFKEATDQAIGFQREIIRLAQYQNTTIKQAEQLGDFVGRLAVQFGTSSQSLVKSSQILAQAGRSTGEIRSILSAIAPASLTASFKDLEGATESLNALLGQFDLRASDATQVLDELNAVAEAFNVSIDELFTGLKRSGSSFAALEGVKEGAKPGIQALREYAAIFTAVIDTTREGADTIGTAFKTILPRFQRGETRDFFKNFGVELLDGRNFVGTIDALKQLSQVTGDLSSRSTAFSEIANLLGGDRQSNRVIAALQETEKIQRAINIAANASGSVAEDAALGQEALEVQIDRTIERFRQLLRELSRTESFQKLAASLLGIANAAITLADALKDLTPLLATFATIQGLRNIPPFSKGFARGASFGLPRFNKGGQAEGVVPSLLTPGEMIFSPRAVNREGVARLNYVNQTGDLSALSSLKGSMIVPGTGNTDSVKMDLESGSFVIKKRSVEKAREGFMYGGPVRQRYADGRRVQNRKIRNRFEAVATKAGYSPEDISEAIRVAKADNQPFEVDSLMSMLRTVITQKKDAASPDVLGSQLLQIKESFERDAQDMGLSASQAREAFDKIAKTSLDFASLITKLETRLSSLNQKYFPDASSRSTTTAFTLQQPPAGSVIPRSRAARLGIPNQFRGSEQLERAFLRTRSGFFNDSRYASVQNKVTAADFKIIAKSSQDIATLQRRLSNQLQNVYLPADDGRNRAELSNQQNARNRAEIQRERLARKRGLRGQTLSDAALSRITGAPDVAPALTPSQIRRQALALGVNVTSNASTPRPSSGSLNLPPGIASNLTPEQLASLGNGRVFGEPRSSFLSRFKFDPRALASSAVNGFRNPISESTFGRIQAGSFAFGAAGGLLTSTATSAAGKGVGGALAGAAFGLQSSLLTANPLVIAFSTLAGAAIGASSAVSRFAQEAQDAADNQAVAKFVGGKIGVGDVGKQLIKSASFDASRQFLDLNNGVAANQGLFDKSKQASAQIASLGTLTALRAGADANFLEGGQNQNLRRAAFGRAGFFSQVGAVFGGGQDLARQQQQQELGELRNKFSGASEKQLDVIRNEVLRAVRAGETVDPQAIVKRFTENADSARLIALTNTRLTDRSFLQNDESARTLATLPIVDLVNELTKANKPLGDLQKNIRALADTSVLLSAGMDRIQSSIYALNDVMTQFDRDVESSFNLAGGGTSISSKLINNVFANPNGVSQGVFDSSLFNLKNSLGLDTDPAFNAVGGLASTANFIKTELPTLLNRASKTAGPDATVSDFVRGAIPNPGSATANRYIQALIGTAFDADKDLPLQGLSEGQISDVTDRLARELGKAGPILADLTEKLNANVQRQDQQALSVANARTGIARQQIGINALGARQQVTTAEILGIRSPLADRDRAIAAVKGDLAALGVAPSGRAIQQRLQEINKEGINRNNVGEFTRLTEALKLLSSDTRILDATMQKANELNQAQQGSRNIIDRLLGGGPQEIAKFNQQLRDFSIIAGGGDVGGPRALEALNNMEQLLSALTPDQFLKATGISKDDAEANLRGIRGEQGRRIFGGEIGGILEGNIRGDGRAALVAEANEAFSVMQKASEILRAQSQAQLEIAIEQMRTQQEVFSQGIQAAFQNAFLSQGSLDLQKSLNNFTQAFGGDKASLEVRGKTDVIVTFNGVNGVFKDIQKDLEGAISRIVNTQITQALKSNAGIAGANSP